jgi:phenylalanyl-tRNA synthetase beta chain
MNIKITYNWLREYLETEADASQMGKYLSLCGASIEHVIKTDDDWVFDVEITSNRIDMASVWGVAQEAAAILPRFGKKAHLLQNPLQAIQPISEAPSDAVPFTLTVENEALMPHAVAVVYDLEQIELPNHMKKRLEVCDIRSVSPLVDITNYIMLSIGQPTHVFDYDRLEGNTLHIRESKKGETVTTLDGKTYTLPGGDIVGVDGSGVIVDLCGIMGGKSSAVNAQTKRAVFFCANVQ